MIVKQLLIALILFLGVHNVFSAYTNSPSIREVKFSNPLPKQQGYLVTLSNRKYFTLSHSLKKGTKVFVYKDGRIVSKKGQAKVCSL